jgi:hypothetical protein
MRMEEVKSRRDCRGRVLPEAPVDRLSCLEFRAGTFFESRSLSFLNDKPDNFV